ncbi:MAG: ABC transporter permease [Micropruina sp.]|nr:ABC transporter permease [Micropruina sp.]
MRAVDVVGDAIDNTLRSKARTALTVVAIVIGSFTLTLTSGVGTGINAYINKTVASIGARDVMTVTKTVPAAQDSEAPIAYDPNAPTSSGDSMGGEEAKPITAAELKDLARVPGVLSVEPTLTVRADYVQQAAGTKYQAEVGGFVAGMSLDLAAGQQLGWNASQNQVTIPVTYVQPLGYASNAAAIGTTVTIGITAANGNATTVTATVVGVSVAGFSGGGSLTPNAALSRALYDAQSVGLKEAARTSYPSAAIRFDPAATAAEVTALKARLAAIGYDGATVSDQLGIYRTAIDAVVLILNGFAAIALLAAGFGIVNTLLMSVQERTREIGLMKAMGMPGGSVFGVFSTEAVFIGLLGSAIGAGLAIVAGSLTSGLLAGSLLTDLPGLQIIAFDPVAIGIIVGTVMAIAFLAGTIPAVRAARQDPIDALRYE